MPPVRFVTFDCAETMIRVTWTPAKMADESARAIGLTLPDGAPVAYARLFAARAGDYLDAHTPGSDGLDAFWHELGRDWLTGYGEEARLDEFAAEADRRAYDPAHGWFTAYPDVAPALREMRSRGLRLAVISNWDASLHRILRVNGLTEFFEVVTASLEFGVEKPDPRIFHHTLERLGARPEEALHVGDLVEDDVVGAEAAGMRAVHIDRKNGPVRTLADVLPFLA